VKASPACIQVLPTLFRVSWLGQVNEALDSGIAAKFGGTYRFTSRCALGLASFVEPHCRPDAPFATAAESPPRVPPATPSSRCPSRSLRPPPVEPATRPTCLPRSIPRRIHPSSVHPLRSSPLAARLVISAHPRRRHRVPSNRRVRGPRALPRPHRASAGDAFTCARICVRAARVGAPSKSSARSVSRVRSSRSPRAAATPRMGLDQPWSCWSRQPRYGC
jgi:hypothetical protein